MRLLKGFCRFWYEFIVGDDWKVATAVVLALAVTAGGVRAELAALNVVAVVGGVLQLASFAVALIVDVRR